MTKLELETHVQSYLEGCETKVQSLQADINREFIKSFCDNPGLATITEHKRHWVHSHLATFSIGFVHGMSRKPTHAEAAILQAILGM